jgi:predicted nucleotidyltransferase
LARYKKYDYSQGKFIPVYFDKQILSCTFMYTLHYLIDNEIDLTIFGSLCSKAYLHERSDIDLLVEGITSSDILRAGFNAWVVVDIIPIEVAEERIIKIAVKEGIEL